ncbi:clathrin associated protein complex large subunit [Tulasnella sp. 331]|nr:clathrin associated protein complex large subunit [Tulasnella sp. 331]
MVYHNLKALIKGIRACKTLADERALIQNESAAIRTSFKEEDTFARHNNIAKLLYIHMLGYPAHFGQIECLKLVASPRFSDKRLGYLGIMLLLDENQEVLTLVTNSLKNDMNHSNMYAVGLALCTFANISSEEMSRDLSHEIEKLLGSSNTYIRKKAALCALRVVRRVPDLLENYIAKAKALLSDRNHGVLLTGITLITEMCQIDESCLEEYRKAVPLLVRNLKSLVTTGYSPEHDVSGITDPFLQIKILRLLQLLGTKDEQASETMNDILAQVATNTDSSKNVGNAILYETVLTVLHIEADSGLRVMAINILGKFLSNRDNNIRYVALHTLNKVVGIDTNAVQRHRNIILDCLRDGDISIRRRALELSYALVNEGNVRVLTRELLAFLEVADNEFKLGLTTQICLAAERFAPNKRWHIDTVLRVLKLAGNYVREEALAGFIRLVAHTPELQPYTTSKLYSALHADISQESLTLAAVWLIGEYGEALIETGLVEEEVAKPVTDIDLVDIMEAVLNSPYINTLSRQFVLTAITKISSRPTTSNPQRDRICEILEGYSTNPALEIQQRAVEFINLYSQTEIRAGVLEQMPAPELKATVMGTVSENRTVGSTRTDQDQSLLDFDSETQPTAGGTASTHPATAPQNTQDLLADIFGSSSETAASPTPQTQASSKSSVNDILGLFGSTSTPPNVTQSQSQQTQPTLFSTSPTTISNPMMLLGQTAATTPQTAVEARPAAQSYMAFDKNGLRIVLTPQVSASRPGIVNIMARFQVSGSDTATNVNFQAAVPRTQQLQMLPMSNQTVGLGATETQQLRVTAPPGVIPVQVHTFPILAATAQDHCTMPDTSKTRSKRPSKTKRIGSWEIGRTIGKGSSGHVRLARHITTQKYAAVKIVSKHALVSSRLSMSKAGEEEDKILLAIEREIVIMKLIDHPNVLSLFDVWETKSELYLVMEYVEGGELFDYLVLKGRLPTSEALHYFQQIIHAVDYCHRFNIAHRDLKPENLLLDKDKNIKVADFGMAAWEGGDAMLNTSCGSPHYASPEVVAGEAYHGSISDIWSCGVILYALMAGRLPFDDDNVRVLLDKVRDGRFAMPTDIDPSAKDLLRRMLEKDVRKRITMAEILKHPFYLSRPHRPMKGADAPLPSLEEVERPVKSENEIDPDIFRNLQTLWHGAPEAEIIQNLINQEKTWEKAVYHLLLKYRAKQLETYNMDDDTPPEPKKRTLKRNPAPPLEQAQVPILAPTKALPQPPARDVQSPRSLPLPPPTPKEDEAPPRPRAPTPESSALRPSVQSVSPEPLLDSSKQTAVLLSKASPREPQSAPIPPKHASLPITVPEITLQGASPMRPSPDRRVSAISARSVDSNGTTSTHSPLPPLPPLQVPQVQDESVQEFFKQIADQLTAMQMRQSMIAQGNTVSGNSPDLQALALAALAYATNPDGQAATFRSTISTAPPPPTPLDGAFNFIEGDSRYEDAPEEYEATRSQRSSTHGYGYPAVGHSGRNSMDAPNAAYGLGITNYQDLQSSRNAPRPPFRNNGGYLPGPSPASSRRGAPPVGPGPHSRMRTFSNNSDGMSDKENEPRGRRGSAYGPPVDVQYRGVADNGGRVGRPRANSHNMSRATDDMLQPRSSIRSDGASRRTPMGEKHVQIVLPSEDSIWTANKMKRRSVQVDESPYMSDPTSTRTTSTHLSIFPSVPQTMAQNSKRSWFTNLFAFKPAQYSLLSVYDSRITRDECKSLLRTIGVAVVVQNSESAGGGVLKCKLDEVRDPAGVMAVVKAVRFRVEFHQTSSSHMAAGYITSLTLVQEKGALSSFKLLFNRLRREWELDVPGGLHSHSQRSSYHSGQANTLRLVPTPTGGSGSSAGYASASAYAPSVRSSAGAPSPALSAGGGFIEPGYLSPIF